MPRDDEGREGADCSPVRPRRAIAAIAIAAIAACAALSLFGARAQAQTVAPIPKLSTSADVPNGFYIEVVDENNPADAAPYDTFDGAAGKNLDMLTISAPAGAKIFTDQLRRAVWCRNGDGSNPCRVAWYNLRRYDEKVASPLLVDASTAFRKELVRFMPPPGQTRMRVTVSLVRDSDGVSKSASIDVEFRDTLKAELRYVSGYRFVRVNGASHPLQRDRVLFRLVLGDRHWDERWVSKAVLSAPEGSYIFSLNPGSGCEETRQPTDDAPGHICNLTTVGIRGLAVDFLHGDIDLAVNVVYFSPAPNCAGAARLTLEMTTTSGRATAAALDMGCGTDVPASLAKPYPVPDVRDGPLRLLSPPFSNSVPLKNDVPIPHEVFAYDARAGSPLPVAPSGAGFHRLEDTWIDLTWTPRRRSGYLGRSASRTRSAGEYVRSIIIWREHVTGSCSGADAQLEWVRWLGSVPPCGYSPRQRTLAAGTGQLVGEIVLKAEYVPGANILPLVTTALYGPIEYGAAGYLDAAGSAGDPVAAAELPDDADQIVGTGETAAVRASLTATVAPPDDREVVSACIHADEAAPPPRASYRVDPLPFCAYDDLLDGRESYLVITGPATWQDNGGKRLSIGVGTDYPVVHCGRMDENLTVACGVKSLQGGYPVFVVDDDAAGEQIGISAKFASLAAAERAGFHVVWGEVGAEWGSHAPAADRPDEVFGQFSFALRGIEQVHAATLQRADASGPVIAGSTEALRLGIRNEQGAPSAASAIDSITITANRGDVNSDWCSAGSACAIDLAALRESAKGSARGPQLIGAIPLNLHLPDDAAGKVEITAQITADSRLITARLELDVRGAASGIALASMPPIVHHHATPEDDDRDIAIIPARAFDSRQRETPFPSGGVREIRNPAGDAIDAGIVVTELCPSGRTACSYRIQVTAPRSDPLDLGRYTLRISAGGASASALFLVVGAASKIEVVAAEPLGIWRTFDFRVRVADGDGNPVADGTPVWWEARTRNPPGGPTGPAVVAITPLVEAYTKTEGGEAIAEMLAVGDEIGILYAHAGGLREDPDVSTLIVVDTGLPDQCTPRQISEVRESAESGMVFATYNGRRLCRASDLFASLDPGWSSLHLWNGKRWMGYAEADGGAAPGMSDFLIKSGDLLCLIAADPLRPPQPASSVGGAARR